MRDIIYVFLWHESEVQGLSAHCNKKVGKHFLMVGSRLAVKWSCTGPRWCKAKDFFVFCAGTICLVCFHGFFVLLFYMSSVSVTQNKCPNSITAILSTYLIHDFLVNVKCRMDGSHRKPFICLSFDFLVQYSANGTCLLNFDEYAGICRPPSGFFARVTLISLAYTETP